MARAKHRQRPWPSEAEQERLQRGAKDFSHLQPGRPCLWRSADRWRDGALLRITTNGAHVIGRHYGGQIRNVLIADARNVQQPRPRFQEGL